MKRGDEVTVPIQSLSARGDGVGDVEGVEVHVAGAFAGERVRARVDDLSRHHPRAFATLVVVIEPHPERRNPPCHRHVAREGKCTGCPLMALSARSQRELEVARAKGLGLPIEGAMRGGAELGYRYSSKRAAGGRPGRLFLGSYVRGSHRVADMRGCLVDHPRITEVADAIAVAASDLNVAPFKKGRGDLRYVWLKTDGERVLATLITASEESRGPEIAQRLEGLCAFAWSVQPSEGNAIRGDAPRILGGAATLEVPIAGRTTTVGPLGFLQPNPAVAGEAYAALVRDAAGQPLSGRLALDLYAGAGVTTAMLREGFEEVIPCEAYPESARALGVEPERAAPFLARLADREVDLIVANPPRAGLGDDVCAALVAHPPARLHVMSCDADSLARDLAALAERFVVERVVAFDTLPQTPHVELVAHLVRR
ncbi:MAG: class I SAM-dependent RNA methyltransferase [Sandaracinaceae bacterium]|nr:class I SAM-dependent RNA methyltransferase [Sandaracinaceae bacterium]